MALCRLLNELKLGVRTRMVTEIDTEFFEEL